MQEYSLVLSNTLVLMLVIVEAMIIKFHLKEKLPLKEIVANANSGHILLWIFRGLEITAYYYTLQYISIGLVNDLPIWLQWLIGFVFWDFCFYWFHRIHHYFSLLWAVHVVHHQGEHFNLSLGLRNSWYSQLTSFPFFIGLAIIGIPAHIYLVVSSIQYFIQFYNHNHLVKKSGWLEYIMITPSHHRVHHGQNDPYIDKNFGGTFVFWDKMFGTFQPELSHNPVVFGVHDSVSTADPIVINNILFLKLFGITFQINVKKEASFVLPNFALLTGALLIFILFLFFIFFENQGETLAKWLLFCLVFLGTIGNGLLFEGKWAGLAIWIISTIVLPIVLILIFPTYVLAYNLTLGLTILHGIYTIMYLLKGTD